MYSITSMVKMTANTLNFLLLCALMLWMANPAAGQDFRDPQVAAGSAAQPTATGNSIETGQDFVPKTSSEGLGLIPVRPRTGTLPNGNFQQFRPSYSGGRSPEQNRVIEQIRSGDFEDTTLSPARPQGRQTIRQRYENGKDQLVRQVIQDEQGNFYNDGAWRLYSRNGELMASGQFANGAMEGTWERWHSKASGGIFQTQPFVAFDGPFVSTATFRDGKLNGVWVISDRNRRKIVEVPYQNGKRHGTATWWYPNSERMRVVNFKKGSLDGPMLEWNTQNELARNDEFIRGRKLIRNTVMYRPKQPSSESYFLDAELRLSDDDNWWDAKPSEYEVSGEKMQHGPSSAWYANGQKKMLGHYRNNVRVGRFTWWHENGQKALAGTYDEGMKVGRWAWWHANGMKSIEGQYDNNQPVGDWTWWDADGTVTQQDDFGDGPESTGILHTPESNESTGGGTSSTADESSGASDTSPSESDIDEMEMIRPLDASEPQEENDRADTNDN